MEKRLNREFYERPALDLAKALLGKTLARKEGKRILRGKIVETEAYLGEKDKASHAFGGKITKRNKTEYLRGGHLYVYLCYGMHWQLNVTASFSGVPECVLLRALEPQKKERIASGPGKLCKWLKLDKSFDAEDLVYSKRIWIEDSFEKGKTACSERIGIGYAGEWAKKPWRFFLKDSPCLSKG